jgi:DNA-binding response OmpR family regulator
MKNTILVCDDEKDIVNALDIYLRGEEYEVVKAYNGNEAVSIMKENSNIDLVLLDVMMPIKDGLAACREIRENSNVPIILLTAKSQDTDKIVGLNIGADDYITKPFNPVELIARVRSQLRRYITFGGGSEKKDERIVGGICLDDHAKKVTVDGNEISLTPTEYRILKVLMDNPGKVFSVRDIYSSVWDGDVIGAEGTVAVHIRHIREKIEINPAEPRYIKVLWGQGYKIEAN